MLNLKSETAMMSIRDYATHSGITQSTVRRLARTQGFPALKVGTRYMIHSARADEWLGKMAADNVNILSLASA